MTGMERAGQAREGQLQDIAGKNDTAMACQDKHKARAGNACQAHANSGKREGTRQGHARHGMGLTNKMEGHARAGQVRAGHVRNTHDRRKAVTGKPRHGSGQGQRR